MFTHEPCSRCGAALARRDIYNLGRMQGRVCGDCLHVIVRGINSVDRAYRDYVKAAA